MAETMRSDGKAVEVTLVATVTKGDVLYLDNFFGIAMQSGSSGDVIAIEIAQREHEVVIPANVAAAKGAVLYLSSVGAITATGSDKPFLKVTKAKDANNVVWGILLPQYTDTV